MTGYLVEYLTRVGWHRSARIDFLYSDAKAHADHLLEGPEVRAVRILEVKIPEHACYEREPANA